MQKDNTKGPNSSYNELEMGPQSVRLSKSGSESTTQPQYENCIVDSGDVVMEDNPAYQSVDAEATKP